MKKSAFTLVELMVAMAIIGVLLGLAIFGVTAAQRAQRDTERKAALQDVNIGIQDYIDVFGNQPPAIYFDANKKAAEVGVAVVDANCQTALDASNCRLVTLKGAAVPGATTSNNATKFAYSINPSGGGYYLAACLESNTTPYPASTYTGATAMTCP